MFRMCLAIVLYYLLRASQFGQCRSHIATPARLAYGLYVRKPFF